MENKSTISEEGTLLERNREPFLREGGGEGGREGAKMGSVSVTRKLSNPVFWWSVILCRAIGDRYPAYATYQHTGSVCTTHSSFSTARRRHLRRETGRVRTKRGPDATPNRGKIIQIRKVSGKQATRRLRKVYHR